MDETRPQKLFVKTFGCQMNEYDSEKMKMLLSSDYAAADSPEEADLVIINTCSVREKGEQKLFSLLGELRDLKAEGKRLLIGVGGCVAQQEGHAILERNGAVDFVVGTHNLSLIPNLVRQVKAGGGAQVAVDYREEWEDLPHEFQAVPSGVQRISSPNQSPIRALVAIQRGCNKRCSYCVVPTTRGAEVSRDPAEVIREIEAKVRMGAREVLLLGQTVNSYGRDLEPRYPFSKLIRRIAEIENLHRIRFISPHPAEVREDLFELYSELPKLARHIHMPVQSGSDRILRLMNRNYRIGRYREILSELLARSPDLAITTDIIVGFPTETDAEFEETLSLVREMRYHSAYYFQYSIRPNTPAKAQFSPADEVPGEIVRERFQRLDALQKQISQERNSEQLGKRVEVLVEGRSPSKNDLLRGRSSQNIIVEFPGPDSLVGQLVQVDIHSARAYHLTGLVPAAFSRAQERGGEGESCSEGLQDRI